MTDKPVGQVLFEELSRDVRVLQDKGRLVMLEFLSSDDEGQSPASVERNAVLLRHAADDLDGSVGVHLESDGQGGNKVYVEGLEDDIDTLADLFSDMVDAGSTYTQVYMEVSDVPLQRRPLLRMLIPALASLRSMDSEYQAHVDAVQVCGRISDTHWLAGALSLTYYQVEAQA